MALLKIPQKSVIERRNKNKEAKPSHLLLLSPTGSVFDITAVRRRPVLSLCSAVILFELGGMEGVDKITPEKEDNSVRSRGRLSCTTCFDALWFCYSPVHQMQQYYRLGVFDNCSDKWTALVDCLSLKTKRASEVQEILVSREKAKSHIWTFRTPEESSSHWKQLFGHLDEME